ncbi:Isoquinoline 1-oxidoreductase subunit [Sphingobium yanoikuyae]|uniref:Isoquinoline 1-oxidoreductase subunit n=2 Tax=Sphingobium yanoikuyae TaxID=13690 RepID=A0A291N7F2_SPHYA|nr:Isoquinoline 1-oxidoreductase subunit [Sphingobium yanoikuyae]
MKWRGGSRPATPRRRWLRIGCLPLLAIIVGAVVLIAAIALWPRTLPQPESIAAALPKSELTHLRPVAWFASIGDPETRSLALFAEAGRVIQHPRCMNCHPRNDRPTQTDAMRLHAPWVSRGPDDAGELTLRCSTCHHAANFEASGVPGNPKWKLAPIEMAWQGKSLGEICRQILDPARSRMDRAALLHHMAEDELVGWAWHPGGKRTPVPGTQAEFGALIKAWLDSGARCPV